MGICSPKCLKLGNKPLCNELIHNKFMCDFDYEMFTKANICVFGEWSPWTKVLKQHEIMKRRECESKVPPTTYYIFERRIGWIINLIHLHLKTSSKHFHSSTTIHNIISCIKFFKWSSFYGWITKLFGICLLGSNQVHKINFQLCLTQSN